MAYTVKKLAELSGVSVRTLHFYDEIGLLKPAYCGDNRYRYYEEEQLLMLQQILFFRELGLPLNEIQRIITSKEFDKVKALKTHRAILEKQRARTKELLAVIDKTINHLEGNTMMKPEELYHGFDPAKQKEYEKYLVKYHGTAAEELLIQSKNRTAKWDKDEWDSIKNQGDALYKELAAAIDAGLRPESDEVQVIILRHYQLQSRFYDLTKHVYIGLSELYDQHPDFKKFFDVYHPKMIEFIGKGIEFFADKNLK